MTATATRMAHFLANDVGGPVSKRFCEALAIQAFGVFRIADFAVPVYRFAHDM